MNENKYSNYVHPYGFVSLKYKKINLDDLIALTKYDEGANEELYKRLIPVMKQYCSYIVRENNYIEEAECVEKFHQVVEYTKNIYSIDRGSFINLLRKNIKTFFTYFINHKLRNYLRHKDKYYDNELFLNKVVLHDVEGNNYHKNKIHINEIFEYVKFKYGNKSFNIYYKYISGLKKNEIMMQDKISLYNLNCLLKRIKDDIQIKFDV